MGIQPNRSNLLRSLALFIGVISLGSVIPDVFRFIQGKEWLGHSVIIPVSILGVVAITHYIRLFTKLVLGK